MENREIVAKGLQAIVTQLGQQADGHMIQSRVFAAAGFSKLADKYAEHATEERGYVSQCVDRMIDLGIEVKLEAKPEGPVCTDYATYDLLKNYFEDEEDLYWGEQQLDLIEKIDVQNWLVQQV